MSDKMRWRYGDTNPVIAAVDADTVIEIGDLLYLDTNTAKPAAAQPDQQSEAANQQLFTGKFLGVAMQRSRAGQTDPIRVATTGVFEFDCPAATFELGDVVGLHENSTGTQLLNQEVTKVNAAAVAVGRAARREAAASAQVLVDIRSTVMTGGVMIHSAAAGQS